MWVGIGEASQGVELGEGNKIGVRDGSGLAVGTDGEASEAGMIALHAIASKANRVNSADIRRIGRLL